MSNGLSVQEHSSRLLRYGSNDIDVPIKPYYALFIEEVLHPFYIFQVMLVYNNPLLSSLCLLTCFPSFVYMYSCSVVLYGWLMNITIMLWQW